ncbi:MAG TPA: GNAT family N-acetyltransferase [Spirochaetota bacterium]|nr:GNAT family N-acetyltransferase [Spirochaetota bacterium]
MSFEFLIFDNEDEKVLKEFLKDFYNPTFLRSKEDILKSLNEDFEVDFRASFVMKHNLNIIGYFLGAIREEKGYIVNLSVIEDFKNMGYGRIILQKGINLFYQNGCELAVLDVMQDNRIAINLYKDEGFVINNEMYSYLNEKNSFYTNDVLFYKVEKKPPLFLKPLYISFNAKENLWSKNLTDIHHFLQKNNNELFILKNNTKTEGYAVIEREKSNLKVNSIKIKSLNDKKLSIFLSLILKDEKKVCIRNIFQDEEININLKKIGFFVEKKQFQMTKDLL